MANGEQIVNAAKLLLLSHGLFNFAEIWYVGVVYCGFAAAA